MENKVERGDIFDPSLVFVWSEISGGQPQQGLKPGIILEGQILALARC